MRQHETEPDEDAPEPDAAWDGPNPRPTDGTRRPGSRIVGESSGSPKPWDKWPMFGGASLARNRTDPSRRAGRTAIGYLGFVAAVIALGLAFLLLWDWI